MIYNLLDSYCYILSEESFLGKVSKHRVKYKNMLKLEK
jgi:hypothetical protein